MPQIRRQALRLKGMRQLPANAPQQGAQRSTEGENSKDGTAIHVTQFMPRPFCSLPHRQVLHPSPVHPHSAHHRSDPHQRQSDLKPPVHRASRRAPHHPSQDVRPTGSDDLGSQGPTCIAEHPLNHGCNLGVPPAQGGATISRSFRILRHEEPIAHLRSHQQNGRHHVLHGAHERVRWSHSVQQHGALEGNHHKNPNLEAIESEARRAIAGHFWPPHPRGSPVAESPRRVFFNGPRAIRSLEIDVPSELPLP